MFEYQQQKRTFADAIYYKTRASVAKQPFIKAAVVIDYYFKDNRRRDADNYSGKIVHDALVRAGVIADDSYSNIVSMPFFWVDKKNPRTVITVVEIVDLEELRDKIRGDLLGC